MKNRRDRILDAAIRVAGMRGTRELTHRAVDAEAGLPLGSTSNYFRSREALVAGVFDRVEKVDREKWVKFANQELGADGQLDPESFAAALASFLQHLTGAGRVPSLARLAVFAETASRPDLQRLVVAARTTLSEWGTDWMKRLGSDDPSHDLGSLMALVNGLVTQQLAAPDPAFDPTFAIRPLLHGMRRRRRR